MTRGMLRLVPESNVVCWVTTFGFWRQTEELEQIGAKEEEVVVYRR